MDDVFARAVTLLPLTLAPLVLLLVAPLAGRRGRGRIAGRGWVGQILVVGLVHRGALVALAPPLTVLSLGTHLDVSSIERAHLPMAGEVVFAGDRWKAWWYLMVVPQLTLWIVITLVLGVVLGAIPFVLRRRTPVVAVASSATA